MTAAANRTAAAAPTAPTDGRDLSERAQRVIAMMRSATKVTRFTQGEDEDVDGLTPGERRLAEILEALGWSGEPRRLVEALPHVDAVEGLDGLADALQRLGYEVSLRTRRLGDMEPSDFPALYELHGAPFVALGLGPDGSVETPTLTGRAAQRPTAPVQEAQSETGADPASTEAAEAAAIERVARLAPPARPVRVLTARPRLRRGEQGDKKKSWTADLLHDARDPVLGALTVTLLANLFAVSTPLFAMSVYNLVVPSSALTALGFLGAVAIAALLTEQALWRVRNNLLAEIGGLAHSSVLGSGVKKVLNLPLGMIESVSTNAQIAQIKRFENVVGHLQSGVAGHILDLPFVVVFIGAVAMLGGPLAFAPIAALLLFVAMSLLSDPLTRHAEARAETARKDARELLRETVMKARSIRATGAETLWLKRLQSTLDREAAALAKQEQAQQIAGHIGQAILGATSAATLGFGVWLAMDGSMSVGALIAVSMLTMKALGPAQALFLALPQIRNLREDIRMIDQLMRFQDETRGAPVVRTQRVFEGALSFDRVGHRHASATDVSLRNVSFDLAPGERLGVVGPAGSGKSTLLRIALGLSPPMVGSVTLDGLPLTQLDPSEFRSAFAFAPDRPHVFYGTIAQNMRLARHNVSDDEIAEMLEALDLPLIGERFPEGVETRLTAQRCAELGVASLQKLNLARAFLSRRPALILDDPTAELDAAGCAAIGAELGRIGGRATAVVATSNRALLERCDKILVLSRGDVLSLGPASAVLAQLDRPKRR